jgi:hypothetical protein
LENVVGGSDDARIQRIISVSADRHGAHGPTKHAEDGVGRRGAKEICHSPEVNLSIRI